MTPTASVSENEPLVKLDLNLVWEGITPDDGCVNRLLERISTLRGVRQVHVARDALCLHYDEAQTSLASIIRAVERAGASLKSQFRHDVIPIEGMDCSDCVGVIEHAMRRMDGVLTVSASYAAQTIHVEYDTTKVGRSALEARLRALGYAVPREGASAWLVDNREILAVVASGILLSATPVLRFLGVSLPEWTALAFAGTAMVLAGFDIARHAVHALVRGRFDTDVLMVSAAIGAAAIGNVDEGALLLFLFALGHVLEERALDRARNAIRALGDLQPRTAVVVRDGREEEVGVEQLRLGDIVVFPPGVRISVDGLVVKGASAVDQAPVTGESVPIDRAAGDTVFAGSVNGEGALEVRVTRLANDSTLARVTTMVREAQTQKSPTQRSVERFERVFVPAVLAVTAMLIVVLPFLGMSFRDAFLRAMTLLVASSPCALALGTPAALLTGIARAAQAGVLIKGGAHLESLGRIQAIAFDKTGTLTRGRPELRDVAVLGTSDKEDEVLALAAALESRSAHPLAQAVVQGAASRSLHLPEVGEVEAVTGRGLRARYRDAAVLVGNERFLTEAGIKVDPGARKEARRLLIQGRTIMFVATGGRLVGVLGLADAIRPDAPQAVADLGLLGVKTTVMLTGDNADAGRAIASEVGISEVRAELMPDQKLAAIGDLVRQHGVVAMVGDGVNDAPALATATVGIAMGGAGTDVALETADVALMSDDLTKLPFAVGLGRATRRVVLQNLAVSILTIGTLAAAAMFGVVGIGLTVLFHEGSTLAVVANALRLLAYGDKR